MSTWHKTGCVLCAQNCGLEIQVENDRMVKVRPDKENPRSQGYACRKGLNVIYHQYPADRLTEPLKRKGNGFEPISWDQAIAEIADKLKELVGRHGPRCLAYMGASGQGGHSEAAFGVTLLRAMGSQYLYSSAGQEFSGLFWVAGRMFGRQYYMNGPDEHHAEMLVAWGWNGMQSHQMPRAPLVLKGFSKDPDRLLVVIDPRRSETAAIANIHLPVRPGTDALLIKAMIAIIVAEGWENTAYIKEHVAGWETIRPWFEKFDVRAALAVCELEYDQVHDLCRLMATRRWGFHPDLGIFMGRRSDPQLLFDERAGGRVRHLRRARRQRHPGHGDAHGLACRRAQPQDLAHPGDRTCRRPRPARFRPGPCPKRSSPTTPSGCAPCW